MGKLSVSFSKNREVIVLEVTEEQFLALWEWRGHAPPTKVGEWSLMLKDDDKYLGFKAWIVPVDAEPGSPLIPTAPITLADLKEGT